MKSFLLFALLGLGFCVQAQDLTGIWRGNFKRTPIMANNRLMDLLDNEDRYKFEIQLDQRDKKFKGVTYSYLTTVFYGKATCRGTINPQTKQVLLEELKIVEVRMAGGSDACVMTLFLKYSKEGDEELLEGNYISMNTKDSTNCGKGTVFLRKVTTSDFYKEPFLTEREKQKPKEEAKKPEVKKTDTAARKTEVVKIKPKTPTTPVKKPANTSTAKTNNGVKKPVNQPTMKQTQPDVKIVKVDTPQKVEIKPNRLPTTIPTPKVLLNRENALVKTITTGAGEITIDIYDNGTIDNDTISVYLDKKLVLSKQRLTEKALTLKFNLSDADNYHELVMVADNLGDIPPNTSLMVVKAGGKQYEVHITSTEQKNAVVRFKFDAEAK